MELPWFIFTCGASLPVQRCTRFISVWFFWKRTCTCLGVSELVGLWMCVRTRELRPFVRATHLFSVIIGQLLADGMRQLG